MRSALLSIGLLAALGAAAADPEIKDPKAYAAVTGWLALWDADRFEEAAEARSELMRGRAPKEKVVAAARNHRQQVGRLEQRKLVQFKPLGGDPRTWQADYDSVYSKQGAQCERVSVHHEDDGAWRVLTWMLQPKNAEKSCAFSQ